MSSQPPDKNAILAKLNAAVATYVEAKKDPLANNPLNDYREPIKKLRHAGASYSDVAKVMTEAGVPTTPAQVSYFIKGLKKSGAKKKKAASGG